MKGAVTCAINQKEWLCTFLDHGEVEISSNRVENAIRCEFRLVSPTCTVSALYKHVEHFPC